jgi:hypothetical protein
VDAKLNYRTSPGVKGNAIQAIKPGWMRASGCGATAAYEAGTHSDSFDQKTKIFCFYTPNFGLS